MCNVRLRRPNLHNDGIALGGAWRRASSRVAARERGRNSGRLSVKDRRIPKERNVARRGLLRERRNTTYTYTTPGRNSNANSKPARHLC